MREFELLGVAWDHANDLGDERFHVRVAMPGTVITGNFHETEDDGAVTWVFDGDRLLSGDAILRVVSVLE